MNGLVVVGVAAAVVVADLPGRLIERMTSSPSLRPDFISAFVPSIAPVVTRARCTESPDFTQTTTGFFPAWAPPVWYCAALA
jgi:hypothetical protein